MPVSLIATVTNDLSQDQRMHRICGTLAKAGYAVTLVGRELPDSLALSERPYAQHRICCRHLSGKRFYWEYNQKLTRYLRKSKPDIINSIDLDTLWAGRRAARSTGARLVYDAHEYFSETPEVVHRPLVRWLWRRVARLLIPQTDARYTVGPALAQELSRVYGLPFGIVRNLPLRQTDLPIKPPSGPLILLYQGMLNRGRGLEIALQALVELRDWQFWVVGKGDLEEDLRRSATQLGVDDRVRWLGFVPPEQLPAITRQAQLGLNLLSADSPSYYYSLANKTFDYIQAGLPAVHMDFPEYRQIQKDHGGVLLLKSLSADELVEQIRRVFDKTDASKKLRSDCLSAAKTLHWAEEEKKLLAVYAGLSG